MTKEEVERRKRDEEWEAKVREEERTMRKEERGWDGEKVMECEKGWRCVLRGLGK
jgi:hypothetical protein